MMGGWGGSGICSLRIFFTMKKASSRFHAVSCCKMLVSRKDSSVFFKEFIYRLPHPK
jgi:hypothetical protein